MYYLAIETSCDETSLALLKYTPDESVGFVEGLNSTQIISSVVSSQINIHQEFGGVVPEIGARQHAEHIHVLLQLLLSKIGQGVQPTISGEETNPVDIDVHDYQDIFTHLSKIFVTTEPGLVSALKVGREFARALRFFVAKEFGQSAAIEEVNHLHGHVISCFWQESMNFEYLPDKEVFPHLHLLVSGGNSQILLLTSPRDWEVVGQTLDDAAGESFDKTGRLLGLPYPAGVSISKIAGKRAENIHDLPRGMLKSASFDYSFSGLKTAVRYYLDKHGFEKEQRLDPTEINQLLSTELELLDDPKLRFIKEMCISIQYVIVEQLVRKLRRAQSQYMPQSLGLSGGVSANPLLREKVGLLSTQVYIPPLYLTGDNAVMIGFSGLSRV